MEKQTLQTGSKPSITLTIDGDLTLKGWDEPQVLAHSLTGDDLHLEQRGEEVFIRCYHDCLVRVPYDAQVNLERVSGHATLKSLEGQLDIAKVDGHLTLRAVGTTNVVQVHGNLTGKGITGDLNVQRVDGNLTLRDIEGNLNAEGPLQGNFVLKDIDGDARAEVNGNITVSLDPAPGSQIRLTAHGNLVCRLVEDASAKVIIERAGQIAVKIPDVGATSEIEAPYEITLGEGDAQIVLAADGNLILSTLPSDWEIGAINVDLGEDFEGLVESLGEQISRQVEAQLELLEQQLQTQLENLTTSLGAAGFSAEHAERIARRAQEAGERARARGEEKLRQAQERMQRKLEATRRRAEMKARAAERAARDRRKRPTAFSWSSTPPPQREPPSDEERLMILQMLEQGKITPEEAEQLLSALEGRQP